MDWYDSLRFFCILPEEHSLERLLYGRAKIETIVTLDWETSSLQQVSD